MKKDIFFVCKIDGCNYKSKARNQLELHQECFHKNKYISSKIYCKHGDCLVGFRTKRQLIVHHNNNDGQCRTEKTFLVKLIREFKRKIGHFLEKKKIDENFISQPIFAKIKEYYKDIEDNLFDKDIFRFIIEDEFYNGDMMS